MATAQNPSIYHIASGNSHRPVGGGCNVDESDENKPIRPPHPRLSGLGKCHKFPYHHSCSQDNSGKSVSVAAEQCSAQPNPGSCSKRTKDCCGLEDAADKQVSGDNLSVSNSEKNETAAVVSALSDLNIADTMNVVSWHSSNSTSEADIRTDDRETEWHATLTSSANLKTEDKPDEGELFIDREKEVVESNGSVTIVVEQRSVSAEDLTEAHHHRAHKTVQNNNTVLTSSSLLHPSHSSSSVSTPSIKARKGEHNQDSCEQQTPENSTEQFLPELVSAKERTAPYQESSNYETPFTKNQNSKDLRYIYTHRGESKMSSELSETDRQIQGGWIVGPCNHPPETFRQEVLHSVGALDGRERVMDLARKPTGISEPIKGWPAQSIPEEVFTNIARFLSREDVCNLRLVNHEFSLKLEDAMFRSIVVPFTTSVFSPSEPQSSSVVNSKNIDIFEKLAGRIYKFGMSFEMDEVALATPPKKEKSERLWNDIYKYSFRWHKPGYTRFDDLKKLEEVADQYDRMRRSFSNLKNVTELGVVIDSGYGWLNAADISDNAIWHGEKPKVFGRRSQPNPYSQAKWRKYFENAQTKAISIMREKAAFEPAARKKYLESLIPSSYESFQNTDVQPSFYLRQGIILPGIGGQSTLGMEQALLRGTLFRTLRHGQAVNQELRKHIGQSITDYLRDVRLFALGDITHGVPNLGNRYPTFPLIFSGSNISADVGGVTNLLNENTSRPADYPLKPNNLTEAQTEWLRETGWAAKAFMSSYICAIVDNKGMWGQVRTLNLSGVSSGMLLNFDRADLFEALPKLAALTVLVIPDWQESEAISSQEGPISQVGPEMAAATFTTFLGGRVGGLELLKELTVGYLGGGERATGMFARNQHVLPAPIIKEPRPSIPKADKEGVLTFGAISKITFKNCWFSPTLLKTFLKKSVALEEIVLESCSLTALPGCTRSRPYRGPELFPKYPEEGYYMEELRPGTWAHILNIFTPGPTLEERHVFAQPHQDLMAIKRPDTNLRRIELKSCGYVKLSDPNFNQNSLPVPDMRSMDYGLQPRFLDLQGLMMNHGRNCPLLGTIIQCIGDDEQQLLRVGFGMHFGWDDDMARWQCVEDGFFEGGTGRFSGVIESEMAESHADLDLFSDDDFTPPLDRD